MERNLPEGFAEYLPGLLLGPYANRDSVRFLAYHCWPGKGWTTRPDGM